MAGSSYNTTRDLEKSNAKWFKWAAVSAGLGVLFLIFGVIAVPAIAVLGMAMLAVGLVVLLIAMVRVIQLSKQPVRHIYCPYCASKNDVFLDKREIPCDICGRKIGIYPSGEVVPLEPVEDDED